jgi:molybdopterin-binding protein
MTGGGNAAAEQNRISGLISRVVRDTMMAQAEIQPGPHRLVSLLSREAADEFGLASGGRRLPPLRSANVSVEIPKGS